MQLPPKPSASAIRTGVAGLVLLVEYLSLSAAFDVQPVAARGGLWTMFAHVGEVALVAVLASLALVVLRPTTLPISIRSDVPIRGRVLASHVVVYLAFVGLTWSMLGGTQPPAGAAAMWLTAWTLCGVASLWTLVSALFRVHVERAGAAAGVGLLAVATGFVAWQVGQLAEWLWDPLWHSTVAVTARVLEVLVPGGVGQPGDSMLSLGTFVVSIDRTCSGFEGMGLAAVFTMAYWYAFRRDLRFPQAFLLLPISVALSWSGNVLRIVVLMWIGAFVDPEMAVGGFHSKAGWVLFCAMAMTVGAVSRRFRFFSRTVDQRTGPSDNPTAAYLLPLMAILAAALVTGLFVRTIDWFYGVRILSAGIVLLAYRRYYPSLRDGWSWSSVGAGIAVAGVWVAVPGPETQHESLQVVVGGLGSAGIVWTVVRALGSATIVPICEELAFRGFLLRRLVDRDFTGVSLKVVAPLAIIVSSLAFGLLHQRWVVATLAGVIFALVQQRSGRLSEAVVAHGVSNGLIALWVVGSGDVSHWMT